MTVFEGFFQGLIHGFTEFLPVSSSGHLSIFQHFFGINGEGALLSSLVFHLGTLLAVFIAFWGRISMLIVEFFRLIKDVFTGKFKWRSMNSDRRMIIMIIISILPLFGFYIFKDAFASLSEDSSIVAEGIGFLYTSALLFLSDRWVKGNKTSSQTTVKDALTIGVFQGIALVPGISRSGSTICAGIFRGLKREAAVEYSFILGIPVILAGALSEIKDASAQNLNIGMLPLVVGFLTATVAGFLAIKLVKWLVKTDKFKIFAFYTLALGILVLAAGIYETASGNRIVF
ncbi:undecaprenyl-diphosphate phosphatase [Caproiciproducens galactitolivorans]|uniref:undecaprenyl-diphosphate phosphatase n=1 Tax=Caproiciproducens galactitolivorans TaxID=642589 RepID=UPI00240A555A|nr:undecaprenyl-diphosphate phosphatase [Caproiciproducens galactitolivorans]